jgi:hypothetical protein
MIRSKVTQGGARFVRKFSAMASAATAVPFLEGLAELLALELSVVRPERVADASRRIASGDLPDAHAVAGAMFDGLDHLTRS